MHAHLTCIPNSLPITQLHYAHHQPYTNTIPNSTRDQSWPKPKQTDLIYAKKHPPEGSEKEKGAAHFSLLLINKEI